MVSQRQLKSPKPFGRVLQKFFSAESAELIGCFVDSEDYTLRNGQKCLRKLLGLSQNDACCDCYCILEVDTDLVGILFEDKNMTKTRNNLVRTGVKQLETTYKNLAKKNIKGNKNIKYAFLCNAKYQYPHTSKNLSGRKSRVLFNQMTSKPVKIRGTEIEIFTY